MKQYEYIDHTADIGMRVYGAELSELFQNAGLGLSDLMTDRSKIRESKMKNIKIAEESLDSLFQLQIQAEIRTLYLQVHLYLYSAQFSSQAA